MTVEIWTRSRTHLNEASPLLTFTDGQEIYCTGDTADRAFRVAFGAVRVYRMLTSGRRQILSFHMAGEWFGIERDKRRKFSAEAIGSSGILSVNASPNDRAVPLSSIFLALSSAQEQQLVVGRPSADERVAAFLLEMSARHHGAHEFELPMPRSDVADYLGLTIETISRAMTRLKRGKLIRLDGSRRIEILDMEALKTICS
ncbi:helix-turn-helix domain-containing protein [Ensifer sp. ENS07]|uniref:helix-turn-helix domain-containing protein n=1 Tax=Ensifer sp. ENS07 TaxID=2769274 RepID=UPI00177DEFEC|nr:helix-turn-helix domain-containing protein [Ensifer sp. ENS07]MBD9640523.1 helix-turn-helix domain-containing protein [Ensifer sp. ENS07]